jgi:hypothetical protein
VTAVLSLSFISAQTEGRRILLGATAGVNMTTYSGDRNAEMGLGGQFGINCDIPVGESFSIMPELIFSFHSVNLDNPVWDDATGNMFTLESTDNLSFMNVPITVKWGTEMGPGRPFVALGPMISIGLFGKNKLKDTDAMRELHEFFCPKANNPKDVKGEKGHCNYVHELLLFQSDPNSYVSEYRDSPIYNNLDFSAYLKLGYDFDMGLSLSAALQWGFSNMYKMSDAREAFYKEYGLDTSQKRRTFSFSVGYSF